MQNLPNLASRIIGTPLLIEANKLQAILAAIGPRIGLTVQTSDAPVEIDTAPKRKPYQVTDDGIAVVSILGPLVKRSSGEFLSGGPTTYGEIENEFMDAATDPAIRGILMVVDSPGGECTGAFELADMIFSQRGAKPIVAVADGDAFSAAYALASSADRLYVAKSGGVGSIGVYMMHVDQSEYNAKLGVQPTFISAGGHKLDGNPHAPLTKDARATFQAEVDRVYGMFVGTVARNRRMSANAVQATEAGLYFGENGVGARLADEVGTVTDALLDLRVTIQGSVLNRSAAQAGQQKPLKGEKKPMENAEVEQAPAQAAAPIVTEPVEQAAAAVAETAGSGNELEATLAAHDADFAQIMDYAANVVDLCVLAGLPKMAGEFIRGRTSLEAVAERLQEARAKASEVSDVQSHVLPETAAHSDSRNINESPIVRAAEKLAQKKEK